MQLNGLEGAVERIGEDLPPLSICDTKERHILMGYYEWKKGKLLSFFKGKGLLLPEVVAEWAFISLFI